jgi:hypothetical protein
MSDIRNIKTIPPERFTKLYEYDYDRMKIDIEREHYSNMAYISVSGRDVYVDFLKMPGVIRDGIPVVSGVRVYMPIVAAKRLAEAIENTVGSVEKRSEIEPLHPVETDEEPSESPKGQ